MEKEIVVNRIARDLKMSGLIAEDCTEDVKFHLGLAWVAGWEQRGSEFVGHNKKPIRQYTKEGKLLQEFESAEDAMKKTKYSNKAFYKYLKIGIPTRRGHIWKYKEA